jgi:hypothetical protein
MRIFAFVFVCAALLASPARADDPPIVTTDPAQYAQTFADSMAIAGVRPIREAFETLLGGPVAQESEAGLVTYERAITQLPARVSRVVEDVTLSGTVRTIYLYHYYGDNSWIFTRLEFIFIGEGRWTLNRLAFADRWANVVVATTPGFQSSRAPAPAQTPRGRR